VESVSREVAVYHARSERLFRRLRNREKARTWLVNIGDWLERRRRREKVCRKPLAGGLGLLGAADEHQNILDNGRIDHALNSPYHHVACLCFCFTFASCPATG
jgi:hypothetical protein